MDWTIRFNEKAEKQLEELDKPIRERILNYLTQRINGSKNPRHFGDGLTANLAGLWRYRVGDYRVVCRIEDSTITVLVLNIGHRSTVYHS